MAPQPNLIRQANTCVAGYQWYVCDFDGADYSGCCSVDACDQNPVGCPAENQPGGRVAQTTTTTSSSTTSLSSSSLATSSSSSLTSSSSSLTSTTGLATTTSASAPSLAELTSSSSLSSTTPTSVPASSSSSGNNGLSIPVGALVGIVIGCVIAAVVGTLCFRLCWVRRQRKRNEAGSRFGILDGGTSPEKEKLREGENSPESNRGFGGAEDAAFGQGALLRDSYLTGTTPHSSMVSPITAGALTPQMGTPDLAELHDTPIHELDSAVPQSAPARPVELYAPQNPQQARLLSNPITEHWHSTTGSGQETVRATLNSTVSERQSGTYANSWTKFQHVQI